MPKRRGKPIRTMANTLDAPQGLNGGNDVDFDQTWASLASAFREIHTKNVSHLSYEENYRLAYRLVLKKKGELLYDHVKAFEQNWLSTEVRGTIRSLISDKTLLGDDAGTNVTATARRVAGERFLKGLKDAWEDHNLCLDMMTDVLMYMNRVYCTDTRRPSILVASLCLFRDQILRSPVDIVPGSTDTVAAILNATILEQIQMEREGDSIDHSRIRACIYMLEGLYETDLEDESQRLYLTSFEEQFLTASREFYRAEGAALLRQNDAAAYLQHTVNRLREEDDRCRSSIAMMTAPKIEAVVEDELIRRYIREVAELEGSGVRFMLDHDRFEDLKRFYVLVSRVDPTKAELTRPFQKRINDLGTEVNANATTSTSAPAVPVNANAIASTSAPAVPVVPVVVADANGGEGASSSNAKTPALNAANLQTLAAIQWVDDVLVIKDKYDLIWKRSFDSDHTVQTALTKSFADFINAFPRSSEFISLFIDDNLKRGLKGKTENEVDQVLEKAIVLLRYVNDKDLFEQYYKKHLARRLLLGKSVSSDVERQMIGRMKLEVGNHFTQKLEGMFKDMTISGEITAGFKDLLAHADRPEARRIELGVHVLTTTFWPLEALGPSAHDGDESSSKGSPACVFPPDIEKLKAGFEKFYLGKHSGRRLTWQASAGTADLRVTFPKFAGKEGPLGKERKHEINVSTHAMLILLLFNDLPFGAHLTFEEIQARTLIPASELVRNLQSLAVAQKTRILLKEPMSKDVKPSDRFCFNDRFTSKFLRIKVGVVSGGNRVEADKERKVTESKNQETRKGIIEAAIVRIMKQRKEMPHNQLYAEVITQLASRFKPDMTMVKKRVEGLIEREYLERTEDTNRPAYRYLA